MRDAAVLVEQADRLAMTLLFGSGCRAGGHDGRWSGTLAGITLLRLVGVRGRCCCYRRLRTRGGATAIVVARSAWRSTLTCGHAGLVISPDLMVS